MPSKADLDQLAVNTIRTLSMDGVQAANSGHPGTPMALAPVTYALWADALRYDPLAPHWPNRDRFVLSCGHASMLLYSVLHLAGVKRIDHEGRVQNELSVSLDDLKQFRQLHSRTPGHPESHDTTGVETTTGPLGQGAGNSVGMAVAARWLAGHFNRPGFELFDYNVYTLCSDGDLMEGVCAEAASLAGHMRLGNLCWVYDDNKITIEGDTELAFSEEVGRRFEGLGWNVARVPDANDLTALSAAYQTFLATNDRPTLIIVRSHIAWGAPTKQDTHAAHGAPLGDDEIRRTKAVYGWPEDARFLVPEEAAAHFRGQLDARGGQQRRAWEEKFAAYARQYPDLAEQWRRMVHRELPENWDAALPKFDTDPKGVATRISSGQTLNGAAKGVPWLLGGSADLAPSTMTALTFPGAGEFLQDGAAGRNFHFGIREHGMAAVLNGMALSHLRPFGATFFVFSDYLRPSMRLSALMRQPVIYIFTHDSIGVGEDGPTHQPIEHLAAARSIPGLVVIRPADANEAVEAWRTIMPFKDRPVALVLTRQNLPTLDRGKHAPAAGLRRGAYVVADAPNEPEVILIGTGSELSICLAAQELLAKEQISARVVSMPSWELFDEQDHAYRDSVLPPNVTARVAVEAGIKQGWEKYLGLRGRFVGLETFGASGPAGSLYKHFGLTPDHVAAQAKAAIDE